MKMTYSETRTHTVTCYRKWWQFWKPEKWKEEQEVYYPNVIDCKNKSIKEVYEEFKAWEKENA